MLKIFSKKVTPEYQIDPAFNKNLALCYTPTPEIDTAKLPTLAENWLNDFQEIILQKNSQLPHYTFEHHAGKFSAYDGRKFLSQQLQLIYHRLQGNLDLELGKLSIDTRETLLSQLMEDIMLCTEGFHNRVNIIVNSFYRPRNLAELLHNARKEIVDNVASTLTNEIHTWNHISIVAANDGLGIKANFSDDHYTNGIAENPIRRALQKSFNKKFTPFNLPNLLIAEFTKFIPELEFEKKNENGLSFQFVTKVEGLIQRFLPDHINKKDNDSNHWTNYFIIEYNKEDPLIFSFININFKKLYQSFFKALLNQNYFETPKINTLTESAYYNLYLKETPPYASEQLIFIFFKEKNFAQLLEQLVELNEKFPQYYLKLSKNKIFITYCFSLIEYLNHQLKINYDYSAEIILAYDLILRLDLRRKEYIITKIADALLLENQKGFNLLMMGSRHYPLLVKAILDFISFNANIINAHDPQIKKKIFLMKNNANLNALMIAALYHSEVVEMLLEFLGKHIHYLDNQLLQDFFLEKQINNYNVLMLAATKQAEAFITILNFLTAHIGRFAKDTLHKLFTQTQKNSYTAVALIANYFPEHVKSILSFITNHIKIDRETIRKLLFSENSSTATCTALMLAVTNQVGATHSILKFISANITNFDPQLLNRMFLEKDENGNTIIILACLQPQTLTYVLNFIDNHFEYFAIEKIPEFFTVCNSNNYNCLMVAADYQPLSLTILLNFFKKKWEIFTPYLDNLFFTRNKKGYHALVLSRDRIESFQLLLHFYTQQLKKLGLVTLNQLFFEKYNFGLTLLMVLAKDEAPSLKPTLEFLEQHIHFFAPEHWPRLIAEKNELAYNTLMLAARNHPESVAIILNFIQAHPKIFSPEFIMDLLLLSDNHENSTLMIAAEYKPEAVKLLLQFTQIQTNLPYFIKKFLLAHDRFKSNALMIAATYQIEAVKPLLEFFSYHINYFNNDEIYDFVFKKVHDKEASIAAFFTENYNARKTILSATAQLKNQIGSDYLLHFINNHIDQLGIKIFLELLEEKDDNGNCPFRLAYTRCPFILKKVLNFIATFDNLDVFKPVYHLVVDFLFDQLTRWPNPDQDEDLFYKIVICCSSFLLNNFTLNRFNSHFNNLKVLTEALLSCLSDNLEQKKVNELNQYYFFRLFSSTEQELQAVYDLKKIFYFELNKKDALKEFATKHYKFLKPKFPLNFLFIASQKIAALYIEKNYACENDSKSPEEKQTYLPYLL